MKDTYWTVAKGTRYEHRVKRCGVCGNTQRYEVGRRPGPCPHRSLHRRIES